MLKIKDLRYIRWSCSLSKKRKSDFCVILKFAAGITFDTGIFYVTLRNLNHHKNKIVPYNWYQILHDVCVCFRIDLLELCVLRIAFMWD